MFPELKILCFTGATSAQWRYYLVSHIPGLADTHLFRFIYHLQVFISYGVHGAIVGHDSPVPSKIQNSSQFSQYFRGHIGTLDGMLIP
jgi:hypothetical protein